MPAGNLWNKNIETGRPSVRAGQQFRLPLPLPLPHPIHTNAGLPSWRRLVGRPASHPHFGSLDGTKYLSCFSSQPPLGGRTQATVYLFLPSLLRGNPLFACEVTNLRRRSRPETDMPVSTLEIDFFRREKMKNCTSSGHPGSSCRRIQNVVSKINPGLLKTVMTGTPAAAQAMCTDVNGLRIPAAVGHHPLGFPSLPSPSSLTPEAGGTLLSPASVLNLDMIRFAAHRQPQTAPLTIFYNGIVSSFDVTSDEAKAIMRMAESGVAEIKLAAGRPEETALVDGPHTEGDDLPIARRKSLQRFLEKRKQRCKATAAEKPPSLIHASNP